MRAGHTRMSHREFGAYSAVTTASTAALGPGTHAIDATLVFADVSGYTALTERLATLGRVGGEMVTETVNACFTRLIDAARVEGGDVMRFGGDAIFLAFTGDGRIERALRAATAMQRAIATLPAIPVPGRRVRLRQSIGVHDGELLLRVWRGSWTEVVPFGPAVTETLRCESAANAGEIAISDVVLAAVPARWVRRRGDGQPLCVRATDGISQVRQLPPSAGDELIAPQVRAAIAAGVVSEHRAAAIGFVAVHGLDQPSRAGSIDVVLVAADRASSELGIAVLSTDVAPGGVKLIVAAGVPTTAGDEAERLAAALCSIVRSADRSGADVHVGAAHGVVFCGDVGHPERRTFTVMGDTVNLAARLAARADRGTVLASAALVDPLSPAIDVRFVEPFTVKGKRALQRAAVITPADHDGPADETIPPPLHGRSHELRQLRTVLESASVVEVVGAAGVGSSRLLASALDRGRRPTAWINTRVGDRSSPLATLRRLVEALGGAQAWAEVQLAAFGARTRHTPAPSIDTGLAAIAAVARGVEKCWADGAAVVIESTHHLDEASRRVLEVLAVGVHDEPRGRLLALTGRTRCLASGAVVELAPLSAEAVRQIAIDASLTPLSDAAIDSIVGLAAGSPLLATQLARLGRDAELPPSAEALVTSRLDRLDPSVRRVVRDLAVIGSSTGIEAAVSTTGRSRADILAAVRRATEVVELRGSTIEFVEESTRVVAAAGMALIRRRQLHASAAAWLEQAGQPPPALVADHWSGAGDHAGVLRWAVLAADAAIGAGASDEACEHLRRALRAAGALGRPIDERFALADRLATSAQRAGRFDLESWALSLAAGCAGSPSLTARTLVRRATAERWQGHLRAAATHLGRARRQAEPTDSALHTEVDIERAWLAVWSDHWDRALRLAEGAARSADHTDDPRLRFAAWTLIEQIRSAKALPGAKDAGIRAVREAHASGDERLVGSAEGNVALIADNVGRWHEAEAAYARSEAAFERSGDVVNVARARLNLSTVLVELGHADEASELSADAARILAAAGDTVSAAAASCVSVRSRIRAGHIDVTTDVVPRLTEALATLAGSGESELAAFGEVALIEVQLLLGRPDDARRRCSGLLVIVDRFGDGHLLPSSVRRLCAVAEWVLGDRITARHTLVDAHALAERHRIVPELAAIEAVESWWALADGKPEAASIVERSLALDIELGIVSRPWFAPRPGPIRIISGT